MERISILVVEDDLDKRAEIVNILSSVEYIDKVREAASGEEVKELLEGAEPGSEPNVIVMEASLPDDGYRMAETISTSYPWIPVIMIEEELKEDTVRSAIFAGAKDVLLYPFNPGKLVEAIYRSFETEKKKQALRKDQPTVLRKKARQGQVITVFSTKGGVGKTFVATNLAVSLALHDKKKVALVDLDLDLGNAALAFNIVPRYNISDIINEIRNLDRDLMESYLIPHQSGIKILAANTQPQMAEFINAEHVELIIKVLQELFDYIVVDMPSRLQDPVAPALHEAETLLLLVTQDVATIRNIKACLVSLHALNYPRHKIKLVLNKTEPRSDIRVKDIEATLNQGLFGILPAEHKIASSSLNKGTPVVQLHPRAKISRNFRRLAHQIAGGGEDGSAGEPGGTVSSRGKSRKQEGEKE
jgi:pilus assembly protein CpaE